LREKGPGAFAELLERVVVASVKTCRWHIVHLAIGSHHIGLVQVAQRHFLEAEAVTLHLGEDMRL